MTCGHTLFCVCILVAIGKSDRSVGTSMHQIEFSHIAFQRGNNDTLTAADNTQNELKNHNFYKSCNFCNFLLETKCLGSASSIQ